MQNYKPILMPANHEYEAWLLASMLKNKEACDYALGTMQSEYFNLSRHVIVFEQIQAICEDKLPVSLTLLIEYLNKKNLMHLAGEEQHILQIAVRFTSGLDYVFYCEEIIKLYQRRKLIRLGDNLMKNASSLDNPEKVGEEVYENLDLIFSQKNSNTWDASLAFDNFYKGQSFEEYETNPIVTQDFKTHYAKFDKILGNLQSGKLYYCGARTSMGKTTFMLNIILNSFLEDMKPGVLQFPKGIISLEMPAQDLFIRLACLHAKVNYHRFRNRLISGIEKKKIYECVNTLKDRKENIKIEFPAGCSIEKLKPKIKKLYEFHGIKILFIDYLSRLHTEKSFSSKHMELDYISKSLQNMAQELDIPFFVLAQLNREVAKRDNPIPTLIDFRESGSIEEDADACILIHRPGYYNLNDLSGDIQVIIAKNRLMSKIGKIYFTCDNEISECWYEKEEGKMAIPIRQYKDD